jgi:hypothetical protein
MPSRRPLVQCRGTTAQHSVLLCCWSLRAAQSNGIPRRVQTATPFPGASCYYHSLCAGAADVEWKFQLQLSCLFSALGLGWLYVDSCRMVDVEQNDTEAAPPRRPSARVADAAAAAAAGEGSPGLARACWWAQPRPPHVVRSCHLPRGPRAASRERNSRLLRYEKPRRAGLRVSDRHG